MCAEALVITEVTEHSADKTIRC